MKRNEILGEISDKTLKNYRQAAHTEIQGAKFGRGKGTPEGEKTIAKREKGMAAAGQRQQARSDAARAASKPRPIPKVGGGPEDSYGKNRYMGDSVERGVAEGEYNPDTFVGKKGTYKGYGITQEGPHQWGISSSSRKFSTLNAAKRHIDKVLVVSEDEKKKMVPSEPWWTDDKGGKNLNRKPAPKKSVSEVAGAQKCWPGHRKVGTQPGTGKNAGKRVNDCEKIGENLEESRSDYVGDAIESLRMDNPGLDKEDFLDELYVYIDSSIGKEAADAAFSDEDAYDEWYDSYNEMTEAMPMAGQAGEITDMQPGKSVTVAAPSGQPGVTTSTQIDLAKNPAALSKNDKGELVLKMTPAAGGAPDATKEQPPQKGTQVKFEALNRILQIAGLK